MLHRYLLFLALICCLASCEKAEEAIVLPPPGSASPGSAELGQNYEKEVFFDFETGKAVFTSNIDDWHLAFEASKQGKHIFLNGGRDVWIFNTHTVDMQQVDKLPPQLAPNADTFWQYDNPNGSIDGTAIGNWDNNGTTKGEVYIVRIQTDLKKMRLLSCDDNGYTIEWMPLYASGTPTSVRIPKDTACNYTYFSFAKGITKIEPSTKIPWDVVFMHYRELVYEGTLRRAIPYAVTGALLNSYRTQAGADSTSDFGDINLARAQAMPFSINRNTIGYDWKSYGLGTSNNYTVNTHKNYVVSTQEGHWYKLHFLDFYREKGAPLFEYERLK